MEEKVESWTPEALAALDQPILEFYAASQAAVCSRRTRETENAKHVVRSLKARIREDIRFNELDSAEALIAGLRVHVAREAAAIAALADADAALDAYNGEIYRRAQKEAA